MINPKSDRELRRFRRQEVALRLLPVALPICVVSLVVAAALSVAALTQINSVQENAVKIQKTTDRLDRAQVKLDRARVLLRESQIRGCEDRRFLRAATNALGSVVYRVLKAAASSDSENARRYTQLLRDVAYAPLPNCVSAVDHADTYQVPSPISFLELDRLGMFNDQTGEISPRRGKRP